MKTDKIFYEKIKEKGYTLEGFAKELGFSRQNIQKKKCGIHNVHLSILLPEKTGD